MFCNTLVDFYANFLYWTTILPVPWFLLAIPDMINNIEDFLSHMWNIMINTIYIYKEPGSIMSKTTEGTTELQAVA